jgi:hypothetical protein
VCHGHLARTEPTFAFRIFAILIHSANQFLIRQPVFQKFYLLSPQRLATQNQDSEKIFLAIGPPLLLYSRLVANEQAYRMEQSAIRFQISVSHWKSDISHMLNSAAPLISSPQPLTPCSSPTNNLTNPEHAQTKTNRGDFQFR